ncbi:MAG: HD domain-containing protein [Defluviitaleaceae bacterium]|nr:HD domain-containing protein [Defluviitaleaceae bacterium]MCL2836884.1 HD domain-containing protein [Defluviitaleaceae bacterium]
MDLIKIKQIAYDHFGERKSQPYKERGDKYRHGERTAVLALKLREKIFPGYSERDKILTVAAWFHDIMNGPVSHAEHAHEGAVKARELLTPHCAPEELDGICRIISLHDARDPENPDYPPCLRLIQDADHLDHFGTYVMWDGFRSAVQNDQSMEEVINHFKYGWPSDVERWRNRLNYELSRRIYEEKIAFWHYFNDRFCVESIGGIWNEDNFS